MFVNNRRKRSSIRRINGPARLSTGRISAPKMHPLHFYDSTYHLLTVMMSYIFRAIRLYLSLRSWRRRCRSSNGTWLLFGEPPAGTKTHDGLTRRLYGLPRR